MTNYNHNSDPLQVQLQGELQGQGQLEGQGETQGEGQSQNQPALDANLNGNGNGNLNVNGDFNGNGNFNANSNWESATSAASATATSDVNVCVGVAVAASLTPAIDLTSGPDASLLYIPETWSQNFNAGGTDTGIMLDQVNSLVANNQADSDSVSNSGDGLFNHDHIGDGVTAGGGDTAGGYTDGASAATASLTTSPSAALDAFTQSIVLGANIQYNNFDTSIVGHDTVTAGHDISHS